tara:strand:- start:2822 stop:2968 length:147 start_codon:yes stop_codon:yes gene_type:complete
MMFAIAIASILLLVALIVSLAFTNDIEGMEEVDDLSDQYDFYYGDRDE